MNPFSKIRLFYQETATELSKSTWPKRDELRNLTFIVIVAVALLGIFVSLADFALYQIINLFTDLLL
jgi:preprotein translocase subunit SecE